MYLDCVYEETQNVDKYIKVTYLVRNCSLIVSEDFKWWSLVYIMVLNPDTSCSLIKGLYQGHIGFFCVMKKYID